MAQRAERVVVAGLQRGGKSKRRILGPRGAEGIPRGSWEGSFFWEKGRHGLREKGRHGLRWASSLDHWSNGSRCLPICRRWAAMPAEALCPCAPIARRASSHSRDAQAVIRLVPPCSCASSRPRPIGLGRGALAMHRSSSSFCASAQTQTEGYLRGGQRAIARLPHLAYSPLFPAPPAPRLVGVRPVQGMAGPAMGPAPASVAPWGRRHRRRIGCAHGRAACTHARVRHTRVRHTRVRRTRVRHTGVRRTGVRRTGVRRTGGTRPRMADPCASCGAWPTRHARATRGLWACAAGWRLDAALRGVPPSVACLHGVPRIGKQAHSAMACLLPCSIVCRVDRRWASSLDHWSNGSLDHWSKGSLDHWSKGSAMS